MQQHVERDCFKMVANKQQFHKFDVLEYINLNEIYTLS